MAINIVAITGRLVRDPEIKQTQSGVSVCSFSVAVERAYKTGDERESDFFDCVAWRHNAEFLQKYFGKGDSVGIAGHLQARVWETDDGQKRKTTEIIVDSLSFVGGKKNNTEKAAETPQFTENTEANEDDLPF